MSTPHGMLEGKSITRPPYFNGQHYGYWTNRMENYIQAEDYELWMLIKNGPLPNKGQRRWHHNSQKPEKFTAEDYKMMEKNAKAKKNSCILTLVQMSILASLSASQPKTIWESL